MSEISFATILGDLSQVDTLEKALELFQTVEMPACNLAARTRKEYTADLTDLLEFLSKRGITQMKQVRIAHLVAYQAEMDRRGYLPSSRHRKTYAIKRFFSFLNRYEYLSRDIAEHLIPPTPPAHEPRYLTEQEYQKLLMACHDNVRDTAIIVLFLQTGMRLVELASLAVNDIQLPTTISHEPNDTGTARIKRKGGKIDTVVLNYKACEALAVYLAGRPVVDHEGLFVSKVGTQMSRRAIQGMITKYLTKASIRGASVHKLRHTFATHHVARGTDLKTVQDMLGHASLVSTEVYIAPAKKVQRQALQEHAL